ncbi:ExeA family protein [Thermodesulfobacteriota bacterium]
MKHLAFFGFTDNPFRMTPDRDFYFPSANHTAIGEVIRFGIQQGDGFIIIIGEVGTGKTMLLRHLMGELAETYEIALLLSPQLTPKQLLMAILNDIGLEDKAKSRHSLDYLLRILNDHLYEISKTEKKLLIIIDEAQNLPDQSIEQLRLLSNFESDKQKWMQIVLVGQPELREKIHQSDLRQLLQRVSILENLDPLTKDEMRQYVHFRLNKAGRGDLQLDAPTSRQLYRFTGGTPRLINKLMGRALLVAYAAQKQYFDPRTIKEAATSLHLKSVTSGWTPFRIGLLATASIALVLLAWTISTSGIVLD